MSDNTILVDAVCPRCKGAGTVQVFDGARYRQARIRSGRSLREVARRAIHPEIYGWMMGFPIGHTACDFSGIAPTRSSSKRSRGGSGDKP